MNLGFETECTDVRNEEPDTAHRDRIKKSCSLMCVNMSGTVLSYG